MGERIRIFVSSPADVAEERVLVDRVIARLQSEFAGRVELEAVLWEQEPLLATESPQNQLIRPSDTDIAVTILWSRLGTRLPDEFVREDGSHYASGTEFEFEDALRSYRTRGKPQLLVYHKTAEPLVSLRARDDLLVKLEQQEALDSFIQKWFRDPENGTWLGAYHPFETASEFESLIEIHLRKLIERQRPGRPETTPPSWTLGSPYRGLEAFEFEHASIFFGRVRATTEILHRLRQQAAQGCPFVLVVGMSGGGKSSVVRAGVVPMLCEPQVVEGIELWRRCVIRPGEHADPVRGLARALCGEEGLPGLADHLERLGDLLREDLPGATALLESALRDEAARAGINPSACRMVLVVDQLEELFTKETIGEDDRDRFVAALDALIRRAQVWVIATLRSDFYPRVLELETLVALKEGSGQYDLRPPTPAEIGQIIRMPAMMAGLKFEESALTHERLDEVLRDAAATNPESLPLLEFTLQELYERRNPEGMLTFEAYRGIGGLEGSLAQRAERVLADLPAKVEDALPLVLENLVSVGGPSDKMVNRRRAAWSSIHTEESRKLLDAFVEARLFVSELTSDGEAIVSLAHEALLREWPRVREWVEQNREHLRVHARVAAATEHWHSEGQPRDLLLQPGKAIAEAQSLVDQGVALEPREAEFVRASLARARQRRRLRAGVVAALGVLGVFAGVAAVVADRQRQAAEAARGIAEIEAQTAEQTTEFLVDLFEMSTPERGRGGTVTAREILDRGSRKVTVELTEQPLTQARLMQTIGRVYRNLGLYSEAEPMLERALEQRAALLPEDNPELAGAKHALAQLYRDQEQFAEAETLLVGAIATLEAGKPRDPSTLAEVMVSLAVLYVVTGRLDEAEALSSRALELREEALGPSHVDVARSLRSLARVYREQGRYAEAESFAIRALEIMEEVRGETSLDTAYVLYGLAQLYQETGRLAEAERLQRRELAISEALLGQDHPNLASSYQALAIVLAMQGDLAAAEPYFLQAIDVRTRSLGPDHTLVAYGLYNYAHLKGDLGDHRAALELLIRAQDIWERALGPEHPDVAYALDKRAEYQLVLGDTAKARVLAERALAINRAAYDANHPNVGRSTLNLANVLRETGRYAQAEEAYLQALTIFESAYGPKNGQVLRVLEAYRESLTRSEQTELAEQISARMESIGAAP